MPASLSSIAAKDGTPATIAGGILAVDKSGAGTGPFFAAQTIVDTQGVNTATVKAASTAAVATDTAVVVAVSPNNTVPVSLASVPSHAVTNAGTFAVQVTSAPSTAVTNAGTFAVQVSNAFGGGRALPGNSSPVVLNSMTYKAVAASATATLFGTTGATGDYLDGVLIIPATAAAGAVSITDGSGSAITIFAGGGTTALPTLAPFFVPIGAVSSGGAGGWKVTTGTNVSVIGVGNFT